MSSGDSVPAGCYGGSQEAAAAAANFLEMFGDYTGELFDLVAMQGGEEEEAAMEQRQIEIKPPSEEAMAAWLYPIVRGDHHAREDKLVADERKDDLNMSRENKQVVTEELLPAAAQETLFQETSSDSGERKNDSGGRKPAGARSHNPRKHSLTEKRRRCKVNERLEMLRQLVPGCHKSNQATLLEQTIQYMKSLQEQLQAMSTGGANSTVPVVAAPPFIGPTAPLPPGTSLVAVPAGMVIPVAPFAGVLPPPPPMLPSVQHPAVIRAHAQFRQLLPAPSATASDIAPAPCSNCSNNA